MDQGWIKLHREILDSDIWYDVTTFRLFIYLIAKASHQDGFKYRGITLNKGQYVRSYRKLADDLSYKEGRGFKKYSLSTIRACVKKLVDDERVTIEETNLGTLFSIVNYEKYQNDTSHFNTLNTLESPNEARTEGRTGNNVNNYSNCNGFSDLMHNSPNDLNDEVRTNAELMPNEVRTNAEQDQELKNLRIKEDISTTTPRANDAIVFYQNNFGMIRPVIAEELMDWIKDFGDEMVIKAMKRSLERNKPNWGYAKSILRSWHEKGIKTVEQVKAEDVEFRNQQQARFGNRQKQKQTEVIPDWFKDRRKGSYQNPQQLSPEDEEKAKEEVIQLLSKHS